MESVVLDEKEKVEMARSVLGAEVEESEILRALSLCGNRLDAAISLMLDTPGFLNPTIDVKRTITSTGARISTQINQKMPEYAAGAEPIKVLEPKTELKMEETPKSFEKNSVNELEAKIGVRKVPIDVGSEKYPINVLDVHIGVKEEGHLGRDKNPIQGLENKVRTRRESDMVANTRLHAHPHPWVPALVKQESTSLSTDVEDGEFPEKPDWFLVGRL